MCRCTNRHGQRKGLLPETLPPARGLRNSRVRTAMVCSYCRESPRRIGLDADRTGSVVMDASVVVALVSPRRAQCSQIVQGPDFRAVKDRKMAL